MIGLFMARGFFMMIMIFADEQVSIITIIKNPRAISVFDFTALKK